MDELAILDELEDVVYLTDPDTYEVYFINRAGLKNSPIKEYKGLPCYKILQGKEHPCEFCTNKMKSNFLSGSIITIICSGILY